MWGVIGRLWENFFTGPGPTDFSLHDKGEWMLARKVVNFGVTLT